jgi:hypothetical protein
LGRFANLFKAKYEDKVKYEILSTYMGNGLTLGDLNKHVAVLAFKLDGSAAR